MTDWNVAMLKREAVYGLDVNVTPLSTAELLDYLVTQSQDVSGTLVLNHNLHSTYLFHTNADFRSCYEDADIVLVDGWPVLVGLNRSRKKQGLPVLKSEYRIGSTDWIPVAIAHHCFTRIGVLGGTLDANSKFIEAMQELSPRSNFLGIPGFPWGSDSTAAAVKRLKEFKPDLLLVGMGMPLQEKVADAIRDRGISTIIATVGGALDQLAGVQKHPPRWLGRLRVEWVWRLASDPRRLASRYLTEPLKLVVLLLSRRGWRL